MTKHEIIQKVWTDVYNPSLNTESTIRKYFARSYSQEINGAQLNLESYIDHVSSQKKSMTMVAIDYKSHLEKGDVVFEIYYPEAIDNEGATIVAEVIARFDFAGDKINSIHGQVRLLSGNPDKLDM